MAKAPAKVNALQPVAQSQLLMSMPAPLQAFVTSAFERIGAIGDDEESLWQAGALGERMEMAGRLIAGRAYKELSTRVDNIGAELKARGIERAGFYYQIAVYDWYESLPSVDKVAALASLGWTKNRVMASWAPQERMALAAGEKVRGVTIDDVADMRSREFEALSRSAQSEEITRRDGEIGRLRLELETKNNNLERMRGELAHRFDKVPLPEFAAAAREEAAAISEKMMLCVESLQKLADTYLLAPRDEVEGAKYQARAAGTVYHLVLPILALSGELLSKIEQAHPDVASGVTFEHQLTKAESAHYVKMRASILEQHGKEAKNREAQRENAKPGKRGRKRNLEA